MQQQKYEDIEKEARATSLVWGFRPLFSWKMITPGRFSSHFSNAKCARISPVSPGYVMLSTTRRGSFSEKCVVIYNQFFTFR
jgi:hypothetical protein